VDDVISVEGLRVDALIGVYPHEATLRQPLEIDLHLHVDIREAARRADLDATIDYEAAARIAADIATEGHHQLVETVAERIAEQLKATFGPKLGAVRVRVAKPLAVASARRVAIEIRR
jgi:dihydroneopterin aldolase